MDIAEIVNHILSYIPRYGLLVCQSWYKIARKYVLDNLYLDVVTLDRIIECKDTVTISRIINIDMGILVAVHLAKRSREPNTLTLNEEQRGILNNKTVDFIIEFGSQSRNGVIDISQLVSIIPHDIADEKKVVLDLALVLNLTCYHIISHIIGTPYTIKNYRYIVMLFDSHIDITANDNALLRCCITSQSKLIPELLKQPQVNNLKNLIPTIMMYYGDIGKEIMRYAGISRLKILYCVLYNLMKLLNNK